MRAPRPPAEPGGPLCILLIALCAASTAASVPCTELQPGQYVCTAPPIDPATQQPVGCRPNNTAPTLCQPVPGVTCDAPGPPNSTSSPVVFERDVPCRWTNGCAGVGRRSVAALLIGACSYQFTTTLLLSIYGGMFGLDRFYLGYPALGLLKLSTFGFFLFGQLVDIILIALQIVGPADGSYYVIALYGPRATRVGLTNSTYYYDTAAAT